MKQLVGIVLIHQPVDIVWEKWTNPNDIRLWNIPFENWRCHTIINEVNPFGIFEFRKETTDGNTGYEFKGRYREVIKYELIEYILKDGRKGAIEFQLIDQNTILRERFEPELQTPLNVQETFCQNVLERFKKYAEGFQS
ncbi:MAG TPA: SRPBCC domain-containing protein [Niabella sp.]|nr:SRPBCC domain-containing protein [Niabella sp.]HOZ96744.1 SRPBCC domain-containing protein [Niabella sp.]HQW14779.1 SRPBCC domain-containing protein [Niabella sp.]HQX19969.1 SRPBCC domain-containing protein [Niabella sp.]HQX42198.1 SRPBCC domain-containing protein [Niabella sp.]